MKKSLTERYYRNHHSGGTGFRRYGFTIGGNDRVRWFRSRLGVGKKVLDIGCRDGTLTQHYLPDNEVTGIDIDRKALDDAERAYGFDTVHLDLNVCEMPFASESFDAVVAGEVLEHLQFPDVVVGEILRVTRSGGIFLGSVPNAFRLRNRLDFFFGRDFERDPTHLHHFSPKTLRALLRGFVSTDVDFLCGRHRRWHPPLLATDMVWRSVK